MGILEKIKEIEDEVSSLGSYWRRRAACASAGKLALPLDGVPLQMARTQKNKVCRHSLPCSPSNQSDASALNGQPRQGIRAYSPAPLSSAGALLLVALSGVEHACAHITVWC